MSGREGGGGGVGVNGERIVVTCWCLPPSQPAQSLQRDAGRGEGAEVSMALSPQVSFSLSRCRVC